VEPPVASPAPRACPVCGTGADQAPLFAEGTLDRTRLSAMSFASRKEPEFMSHRLVQCPGCDLVYVPEPPAQEELAHAYHTADYDSAEEAEDAAAAYIRAIGPILARMPRKEAALEIGTGTGIFLDHLSRAGFTRLAGVEPSAAAIAAAPDHRRAWITMGMFDENAFAPASFDLVCCFMTMEHVHDPSAIARSALRLLRPGGAFVTVTHDYRSVVNRLLGKRSPIIDIEHMQLFSPRSIHGLLERAGYSGIAVSAFVNTYALRYWMRLAPLPRGIKAPLSRLAAAVRADGVRIGINVGNMIAAGFKAA
jgi:SAM-dependent methyltransferase